MKKTNKLLAIILMLMMIMQLPGVSQLTFADPLPNAFPFITGAQITTSTGGALAPTGISTSSSIRIRYDFTVPNDTDVTTGAIYTMQIPSEIKIVSPLVIPLVTSDATTIASVYIATSGAVEIIFTADAATLSNVAGFFYVGATFNQELIGTQTSVPITFVLGGTADPVIITVNFIQPDPTIEKARSYDPASKIITWTLKVNKEKVAITNAAIIDTIQKGQEYVEDSWSISPYSTTLGSLTYSAVSTATSSGILSYSFNNTINEEYLISFQTKITDVLTSLTQSSITYANQAFLNFGADKIAPSNVTSVAVTFDFITKNGTFNTTTKAIDWTITVNGSNQTLTNAAITDNIPTGLALVTNSVKLNGTTIDEVSSPAAIGKYSYNASTSTVSINLGTISTPQSITFSTALTDSNYFNQNVITKTFTNTASLTVLGLLNSATSSKGVPVSSSVIAKSGTNYNPATQEITWRIVVNSNKISITSPAITDNIPLGQEYVSGSALISPATTNGSFTYTPSSGGITGTLKYDFTDDINSAYTITFKTKVTNANDTASNKTTSLTNSAIITGANIPSSSSTGTQSVVSKVLEKSSTDYNYVTRELTWRIVVNQNGMNLSNSAITDSISNGQDFVTGSAMLNGSTGTLSTSSPAAVGEYYFDGATKTLQYNLGDITTQKSITFKTIVTDLSVFNTNGDKTFSNTATLTKDFGPTVTSTGTKEVNNTVVSKAAIYTSGNEYIDWKVQINSNQIALSTATLTDVLQEGLELDAGSVQLFHQTLNPNGSLTITGSAIPLDASNIAYNQATRTFIFTIPAPVVGAYILTFTTDVIDKTKSPFSNSISFNGTGTLQTGTQAAVTIISNESGGGASGTTGSMTVVKVDSVNSSIKLTGVAFELLDQYQNVLRVSSPTGINGSILFNKLKFARDYYIRELNAPAGYLLSSEMYKFQVNSGAKDLTYEFKNTKIPNEIYNFTTTTLGSIKLLKVDAANTSKFLAGAVFELRDQNQKLLETSMPTDSDGITSFDKLALNTTYYITEKIAPTGYILSTESIGVTVNSAETKNVSFVNEKIATDGAITVAAINGSVSIVKIDERKNPLAGATFKIYDEKGIAFGTSISGTDGMVLFKDLPAGEYTIKETQAPTGYKIVSTILKVEVEDSEEMKYKFRNLPLDTIITNVPEGWLDIDGEPIPAGQTENPEMPKTGGISSEWMYWLGLILIMQGLYLKRLFKIMDA
ncbi:MAG: collagen binding domain-containing protein [Clostridia bacterium]